MGNDFNSAKIAPARMLVAEAAKEDQLEMTEEQRKLFSIILCLDFKILGNCILEKENHEMSLIKDCKNAYELD